MYTKLFSAVNRNDALVAGGKGASLGEMSSAGIPVPGGYVVLADTFDRFLAETDLTQEIESILGTVDNKAIHTVEDASEKIQGLIKNVQMPKDIADEIQFQFKNLGSAYVAVRSSATAEDGADHAWAGQLSSYLNTTEESLLLRVQDCWASLFTPRAIFYRFEKELHDSHISVAVVVQTMINSEKSGIAFSVHPVTEDHNQIIIEAGLGLGEAIVSGSVTPDSYVITKEPFEIIDVNVNEQSRALYRSNTNSEDGWNEWKELSLEQAKQQVLSAAEVIELSLMILRVENHYGFPCDIEWAYESGKFYIVQSRPITTLQSPDIISQQVSESGLQKEVRKWVNLWEAPATLLQTDCYARSFINNTDYKHLYGCFPNNVLYVYKNKAVTANHLEEEISRSAEVGLAAHRDPDLIHKVVNEIVVLNKEMYAFGNEVISIPELSQSTDERIAALFDIYFSLVCRATAYYKCCNDEFQVGVAKYIEDFFTDKGVSSSDVADMVYEIATPTEINTLDKYEIDLLTLALKFKEGTHVSENVNVLSNKYGWIGTGEGGYYWDEEHIQKELENLILTDTKTLETRLEEKQLISKRGEENRVNLFNKFKVTSEIAQLAEQLRSLSHVKLESRIAWAIRDFGADSLLSEISRRYKIPRSDLSLYSSKDFVNLLQSKISLDEVELDKRNNLALFLVENGELTFYSGDNAQDILGVNIKKIDLSEVTELRGSVANKGKIIGNVVIVSSLEDQQKELSKVKTGDVLVTGMTRPHMMPAMQKAVAFITDEGGITCHAAIVAREMNKPCIIATRIATKVLKDGDLVEVDADNGVVRVLVSDSSKRTKPDWVKLVARNQAILHWDGVVTVRREGVYIGDLYWKTPFNVVINENNPLGRYYVDASRSFESTSNLMDHLDEPSEIVDHALQQAIDTVERDLMLIPGNTKEHALEMYERFRLNMGIMVLGYTWVYAVQDKLRGTLPPEAWSEIEEFVMMPIKKSHLMRENEALVNLQKEGQGKDEEWYWDKAKSLATEYGYIHSEYRSKSWTADDYFRVLHENPNTSVRENQSPNITNFSEYQKWLLRTVQKIVYIYDEGKTSLVRANWALRETLKSIELDENTAFNMTGLEFKNYVLTGRPLPEDELQRRKYFAIYSLDEELRYMFGEIDVKEFVSKNNLSENSPADAVKELKGKSASKGNVKGRVRLVFDQSDSKDLVEGEVLVASMTTPEHIDAMRKSAAFITDEGGITCHAAIIAREFGKPCVIATGNATQILKNGDLVEVDADNGVVRIIKQENQYFKPEEYQRMFAGPSFALLMSDIFLKYYSSLDVLSVQDKTQWMSFIPKEVVEDTQIEGEKMYTNEVSYRAYKDSFIEYMNSAQKLFESLLSKETQYSGKDVEEFLLKAAEHFSYYSKTEFFYTDKINHRELIPTIEEFDELKLQGRSFLNKIFFEDDGYLIPFIKKLTQQTSQLVEDLMLYSVDELVVLTDKNIVVDPVVITLRKEGFIVSKNGPHYGQEFSQNIQDLLNVYRGKSDVIKGTIANKGKVTALARVLLPDFSDFKKIKDEVEKMQNGEILVAETTAPEIITACKKASGIITNQGGMLSHAAIISRELNIPCIVGTDKDVTANIKTGDRVELDADTGVIKIFKI